MNTETESALSVSSSGAKIFGIYMTLDNKEKKMISHVQIRITKYLKYAFNTAFRVQTWNITF
jgi:hypothetical protein